MKTFRIAGSAILLAVVVGVLGLTVRASLLGDDEEALQTAENPVLQRMEEDTRMRFVKALEEGNLSEDRLTQAAASYRAVSPNRATGTVISLSNGTLILERMLDGESWQIKVTAETRVARGETTVGIEQLEPGEVVEVLSQDGHSATFITSFKFPVN